MVKQLLKSTIKLIGRIFGTIMISLIKFYQLAISPYLGSSCRHTPTCSNYMLQAIREWGTAKGIWMGLKRLMKCHPWGTSGYDPVPKKSDENSIQAKSTAH